MMYIYDISTTKCCQHDTFYDDVMVFVNVWQTYANVLRTKGIYLICCQTIRLTRGCNQPWHQNSLELEGDNLSWTGLGDKEIATL